jgi:aryl-alcohol dehydrogenase-like predicted oxidoreductase
VLARVPLASGLLSGKYKAGTTFTGNDVRAKYDAEKLQRDLAEVERLQRDEVPAGVPMAEWAMAWCLRDPLVTAIIPGCKNPAQVRANAAAAARVAA